jgi:NOL1/NOP2/fmu family ribosome biogenesis protein
MLDARPGERVLDLCAAPGGKTARIAFALGNRGTVIANDVSRHRMPALRDTIDRLGLLDVSVTRADGGSLPSAIGTFDRVLVDAPCSGEGTVRKISGSAAHFGAKNALRLQGRQIALLRKAVQRCRPGGRVVYATCSFAPEENEAVVDAVLREDGGRSLRVADVDLPGLVTSPGVTAWEGARFADDLRRAIRLWPHHNDTGGFFAVALDKDGDVPAEGGAPYPFGAVREDEWVPYVTGRFGIPDDVVRGHRVHRRTQRGPHLVALDHAPPVEPDPESVGIRFMKTKTLHPKLTTPGAQILGPHATRNVVELTTPQLVPYLARMDVALDRGQDDDCSGEGYVIVRHRGHVLGLGLYRAVAGRLESLVPRRWSTDRAPGGHGAPDPA